MKGGTLFSGIGAPEYAARLMGLDIDWRWCAEFDPGASPSGQFAAEVHRARFPDVPNLGDVTRIDPDAIEPVDLVVFGSPCQSFSVAGKRLGLDDPRGNLALVALGLIGRIRPRWLVFENVPGLLSSDGGADFVMFLDALEDIGYIADIDILDAQFFGVPQRRRRVFVCAQRVDDLMSARTISSALTIAQCLAEISALHLAALKSRSVTGLEDLGFDVTRPALSLQRRMKLFGPGEAETASMLPANLGVLHQWSASAQNASASENGSETSRSFGDIGSSGSSEATEPWRAECLSIVASWNDFLAGASLIASGCITSTSESAITERIIYSSARILLHIAAHITPSMDSSPSFWSAASSISTALEAFIDYAGQASSDLFTDVRWLHPWSDFLRQAERAIVSFDDLRIRSFGSLRSLRESLRRDTPPRREAGKATPTATGIGALGGCGVSGCGRPAEKRGYAGRRREDNENLISFGLDLRNTGGGGNIGWHYGDDPSVTLNTQNNIGCAYGIDSDCFDRSGEGASGSPGKRSGLGIREECSSALRSKRPNAVAFGGNCQSGSLDVATAVNAKSGSGRMDFETEALIAHSLRAEGFDASEDGTGRGTPLVFDWQSGGEVRLNISRDVTSALQRGQTPAVAFQEAQTGVREYAESGSLRASGPGHDPVGTRIRSGASVRRLLPGECERLQGFCGGFTLIRYRGKPAPDGPRYRALGNSMAVPVIGWILHRLCMVDAIPEDGSAAA